MLGISPMVGIWGAPHAPKSDASAIRSAALGSAASLCEEPNERRRLFGEPTPSAQYLRWRVFGSCPSPRVYMGSAPYLQCQTLPLFGVPRSALPLRSARTQRETQAIWGANPKPPISPMVCIWELPKPQGVYGERPMPPMSDAAAIRGAETNEKTQAVWGANPKPPISPMVCIWELPKPQGVYGECPMPPMSDAAAIRGAEPNEKTQAVWGASPKPQGCLWGAPHAPKAETLRYLGGPKPHIIFFNFLFFNFSLFQCYRTSTGTPRRSSDN